MTAAPAQERASSVVFRRVAPADALSIAAIACDPEVYPTLIDLPHPCVNQWHAALARLGPNDHWLCAVLDGALVGWGNLQVCADARRRHVGILGVVTARSAWGRGVATATVGQLLDLADRWLDLKRVELSVLTDNTRAMALYERCGFAVEGTQRRYVFRSGSYADAYLMSRLRN
jgi:L-phenylalanine/L-methionine N-acetyltransferase